MTDHTKPIEKLDFRRNFEGIKTYYEGSVACFEKIDEIIDRVNYIQAVLVGAIPAQPMTVKDIDDMAKATAALVNKVLTP